MTFVTLMGFVQKSFHEEGEFFWGWGETNKLNFSFRIFPKKLNSALFGIGLLQKLSQSSKHIFEAIQNVSKSEWSGLEQRSVNKFMVAVKCKQQKNCVMFLEKHV